MKKRKTAVARLSVHDYEEIKAVLCQWCRVKLPDTFHCGAEARGRHIHMGGHACDANTFRTAPRD